VEYITRTVTIYREGLVKVSRGGLDTDFADAAAAAAGVALARGRRNCWVNPLADFFFAFVLFFGGFFSLSRRFEALHSLIRTASNCSRLSVFFFRFAATHFFSW
jgi:hypothetical protein